MNAAPGNHVAARRSEIGLISMVVAALVLVGTIDVNLNETSFKLSLALFGVGAGLMMSQIGRVKPQDVSSSINLYGGSLASLVYRCTTKSMTSVGGFVQWRPPLPTTYEYGHRGCEGSTDQ